MLLCITFWNQINVVVLTSHRIIKTWLGRTCSDSGFAFSTIAHWLQRCTLCICVCLRGQGPNVVRAVKILILELNLVSLQSLWAGAVKIEHLPAQSGLQVSGNLSVTNNPGKMTTSGIFPLRLSATNDPKYVTDWIVRSFKHCIWYYQMINQENISGKADKEFKSLYLRTRRKYIFYLRVPSP